MYPQSGYGDWQFGEVLGFGGRLEESESLPLICLERPTASNFENKVERMAGDYRRSLSDKRMTSFDYWRLCDHLTIVQAALLILDLDPAGVEEYIADWEPHHLPPGYSAVYAALGAAVQSGRLNHPFGTKIRVADLREWLVERRVKSKFFFPDGVPDTDYLNPSDPCFSPKLSAAVKAWEAIRANPSLTKARSPKQALIKWLNEHATELGLADEDGRPITKAVEDVATVANWNTAGGAPKTPTPEISAKSEEPDPLDWLVDALANS